MKWTTCTLVPTNQRWRRTWQFMMALLLKKWKPLSCQLQVRIKVSAGSHEPGARRSTFFSSLVIWPCLGFVTSVGGNLWDWGGTTVIIDPQLTPPHLQLNNRSTSAFWMVLSGEATGSPFPQTQNTLTARKKYFIFRRISFFPVLLSLPRLILADCFTPFLLSHDRQPLNYVSPQKSRRATPKIILTAHIQRT